MFEARLLIGEIRYITNECYEDYIIVETINLIWMTGQPVRCVRALSLIS